MYLQPVERVDSISPQLFQQKYFPHTPLVIRNLSHDWPAYTKWNWNYFKQIVGTQQVALYNNTKSDAYTPINKADAYVAFGDYLDMISKGPAEWRIFLFNIFQHAPQLTEDFTWPHAYAKGFVKKFPMLFVGGEGAVTHMHFDIDMSHIFHTQFIGKKRVLLFPFKEKAKLYRKPFEVLTLPDFTHYYDAQNNKINFQQFPAVQYAQGYEVILEHGDTLFMPAGYWHHMEYIESGFAMSLRALHHSLTGKLKGVWNLMGMRNIDTLMKKTAPQKWYMWKEKQIYKNAQKELQLSNH
jgi:hypothetical protein